MFLRDFCVSTTGRERRHQAIQKEKKHCGGAVDTSTRAVACALTCKPRLLLFLHSTRAVANTVKNLKKPQLLLIGRGGHLLSNDLLLSSSALLFWRSYSPLRRRLVTRCKRCRRFRTAPAVELPVCNGKTNNTHTMTNQMIKLFTDTDEPCGVIVRCAL